MPRTCASCGLETSGWNPFRRLCDVCQGKRESARAGERLVVLGAAENELEANIWRDVLAQEGIPSATRETDNIRGRFQTAPMPFGIEVLVFTKDLEAARELIQLDGVWQADGEA